MTIFAKFGFSPRRAGGLAALVVGLFAGAAQAEDETRAGMIAACRADYVKFCREVTPGGGAILGCLKARAAELSSACREVVTARDAARPGALTAPTVISDLSYGAYPAEKLDVHAPAGARGAPIILMVHGGAWRFGDKARDGVVEAKVAHFVGRGYILVSANYRMLPDADPVAQAEDVARALAFVQARAATWGGDGRRVVAMGHSAGAHLMALLAAAPELREKAGAAPAMATIALDSAVYDLPTLMATKHLALYDQAFGSDPSGWKRASPVDRMTRAAAPMLLVCSSGRGDSCPQARIFAAKAQSVGGRAEVLSVSLKHMEINRDLGRVAPYTEAVDQFLASLGLP